MSVLAALMVTVLRIGADLGRKPTQALGDAVVGTTDAAQVGVAATVDAVHAGTKPRTWRKVFLRGGRKDE